MKKNKYKLNLKKLKIIRILEIILKYELISSIF